MRYHPNYSRISHFLDMCFGIRVTRKKASEMYAWLKPDILICSPHRYDMRTGFRMSETSKDAAHGGSGWSPRVKSMRQEIGSIWETCGISNEWSELKAVLMHRPGPEIEMISIANEALMHSIPEATIARRQHDDLVQAYRDTSVTVFYLEPPEIPPPNQMYIADLFFMTPEGAILARPASTVRAGEERFVAQKLAKLNIPILRCIRGNGVFEGADASWLNLNTVILGTGLRTNSEGAAQIASILREMSIDVIRVDLPRTVMHLMGTLRLVDQDTAICWKSRFPHSAIKILQDYGYTLHFVPDEQEAMQGMALNFVTLGPKKILMPIGNPRTQSFYENMGIKCVSVEVSELHKAAGGIGCLTGILRRES